MKVTLPYPPSANRYWRAFRGRTVLSAEAKTYKKQVAAILSDAGWEPASGAVSYVAHIYRPLKSGDLDNRLKVLGDALTGFAWVDDKQVVELHAYRHDDKANPRVEVEVTVLREDVATPAPVEVVEGCVVAGCSREARAGSPFCGLHNTPNHLRPKPKVKSAYRAAKEAADVLPRKPTAGVGLREDGHLWQCENESGDMDDCEPACRRAQNGVPVRPSRGVEGELQSLKQGGAKAGTGDARAVINALRRQNEK